MSQNQYAGMKIKAALQTYTIFKLLNLALAFAFQIVVVKILAPEHYATYAILLAVLLTGERALSFGIDRTVLRFVPSLTINKEARRLRTLFMQIASIRLVSLSLFVIIFTFGTAKWGSLLPIALDLNSKILFAIWFVCFTLYADADAFAQSWLAHFDTAYAGSFEIIVRFAATLMLGTYMTQLRANEILLICSSTSAISLAILSWRLRRFGQLFNLTKISSDLKSKSTSFDSDGAPMFAFANYASTLVYLISSPSVVRIIAVGGLNILTLAAFSFAQGLFMSLQRVFPGLLILPTLEPILMSRLFSEAPNDQLFSGLSVVYKMELICIFAAVIATAVAGPEIVTILSRREYAQYSFLLPILMSSLIFITSYRVFEIVANMHLKQNVFFALWPLSIICMFSLYLTVDRWGLISILFWPFVDIATRIALLSFLFRRYGIERIFDIRRAILIGISAIAVICITSMSSGIFDTIHNPHLLLVQATAGVLVFLLSLLLIKPLQQSELDVIKNSLPKNWKILGRIARMATKI